MLVKKNLKARLSILSAICLFAFASCDFGFDGNSFQNKAGAYFKEMTSTAAISSYDIQPKDYLTNSSGVPCLPCTGDHTVTFYLRNPQKYSFARYQNMDLGLSGVPAFTGVEIEQDAYDKSKITVTYSEEFLRSYGMGTDVTPLVTLYHPWSHANFGLYNSLAISSDNPPPTPSGAVCMQSGDDPSKWVLCFDLPKTPLIKELHQDISSISVNGQLFGVSVDADGNISYSGGASLTTTRPSGLYANQNTGQSFASQGQGAYFMTADNADENEKIYSITVTDKAGLSSSLAVSARGFKLSAPKAYLTDDTSYSNEFNESISVRNPVPQEEDGSAHITSHAEPWTASVTYTDKNGNQKTIDPQSYNPYDAKMFYEVYTDDAFTNLVGSGRINGLTGKVTVPGGTSYVRAYVQKPLYSDSEIIVWNCRAICGNYFVSAVGGSDGNAGSKASPLATIAKAVEKFEDGISAGDYDGTSGARLTVQVMTDLSQTESVTWNHSGADDPILRIKGYGGARKVDYGQSNAAVYVQGGTVLANGITFANCSDAAVNVAGGATFNCADCAFEDCYRTGGSGGAIFNNGGVITVERCSFLRCRTDHATGQGGAVMIAASSSSATITGSTFKSCHAPGQGSAIYNAGYLLLGSSTITENTSDSADCGAVVHSGESMTLTEGASYILGNKDSAGKARDLCLALSGSASHVFIAGALTGSQIGVYMPFNETTKPTAGTSITFTGDWSKFNSVKPGVVFKSNTIYGIANHGSETIYEAAFAVSGGSMYSAFDYEFAFTKAASAPQRLYPGMAASYEINLLISRKEQSGSDTQLFLNPADRKLYTSHTGSSYAGLAADEAVSIKAELWNGGSPADENLPWTVGDGKITVSIPAGETSPGPYSVKLILTFLEQPRPASFSMTCDKTAETVAEVISKIPAQATATTYSFAVEGAVGPLATDGLAKVADAIRTHGNADGSVAFDNVMISLDARATSMDDDGSDPAYVTNYNDGEYFKNCSALTAIQLPDWMTYVCHHLFNGCSSLSSVTLSPNTQYIGEDAFNGCQNLASISIPVGITGPSDPDDLHGIDTGAFDGCKSGFAISYDGTKEQWSNVMRSSGAWHDGGVEDSADDGSVTCSDGKCGFDYRNPLTVPLTLEAIEDETEITYHNMASESVYYSINGGAGNEISAGVEQTITLNAGHKVEFYGDNPRNGNEDQYTSNPTVKCDKLCYVYGNFMSLVNKRNFATEVTLTADNAFRDFFNSFGNKIENKPGHVICLPATTLTKNCYARMFENCNDLQTAPDLPATTLAEGCYREMFCNCSLTSAPALPATTLAKSCYYMMFYYCDFTDAPDLPATTLAEGCYEAMFRNCSSLSNAPALPATTLAKDCYDSMFDTCESLERAPDLPAPTLANGCYRRMFSGCSRLNRVTCLATNISADYCTLNWLSGVTSNGVFYYADGYWNIWEDKGRNASAVPSGWSNLEYEP